MYCQASFEGMGTVSLRPPAENPFTRASQAKHAPTQDPAATGGS